MKNQAKYHPLTALLVLTCSILIVMTFSGCDDPEGTSGLDAPSDIMVTVVNDHTVMLTWEDNSDDEDGFKIARKTASRDEWEIFASVGPDTTSYNDASLLYTGLYWYKVAAYKGDDMSDYSGGIVAPSEFPPPDLSVRAVHETKIEVYWDDIWDYELEFELYRRDTADFSLLAILPGETTSYIDEGREYGLNYIYSLIAFTSVNRSGVDSRRVNTTINAPDKVTSTFADSKTARISWSDNCTYETAQILEYDDGTGYVTLATLDPDVTEYLHPLNVADQPLKYRVLAETQNHQSDYGTAATLGAWFSFNVVAGGDYTYGPSGDTLSDLATDYSMLNYEVTNRQYIDFLNFMLEDGDITVDASSVTGAYAGDVDWAAGDYLFFSLDAVDTTRIKYEEGKFAVDPKYIVYPVNHVSWFGANAFANYYNLQLPTEFEWEKAARGISGADYPWSGTAMSCGDAYTSACGDMPDEVGGRAVNQNFGKLYDMVGNVSEWTLSTVAGASDKVLKGGSFLTAIDSLQVWQFTQMPANETSNAVGFRVLQR